MNVIAFYLPQFYAFPENDKWWGKGFTEWTNVKKSKPLYKGHYQPTVPLDENYYSLEDINTMAWQANLAKTYGLSGFCFYHYWFGEDRQLMEKPVDNYLLHSEIDFPFCLCWANHNWSRTWVGGDKDILMDVKYGDESEWEKHFQYLLPFFKDPRYIKKDGKPLLVIYQPQLIPSPSKMISYWQRRATEEQVGGITIVSQSLVENHNQEIERIIDYKIQYEPNYSRFTAWSNRINTLFVSPLFLVDLCAYKIKGVIQRLTKGRLFKYRTYSYDAIWHYILHRSVSDSKWIPGAFVKCDVTPRRQERALIYKGDTPRKFGKYMKKLIHRYKNKNDLLFLSAWNEWGEGMYLEPDEKNRYGYLEGLKNALESNKKTD